MNVLAHGTSLPARRAVVATTLCLFVAAGLAQPTEPAASDIRFSGFGTLGVVNADAPAGWGFRRDIAQPANGGGTRADIDSRLGLQLNYTPSPQFEMVGQVLATRRSRYASDGDSIEWAFAAYRPRPDVDLRVGRVNLDQFLMSDYRHVGFAYRYARPPVEFYGSLPTSLDGADLARTWNVGGTQWRLKAFAGSARSGDLSSDGVTHVKPVIGAMASREADGLLLRAGLTRGRLGAAAPALRPLVDGLVGVSALPVAEVSAQASALRSRIDFEDDHVNYAALAVNYERSLWQWTAEITHVTGHPVVRLEAGYAGVARRFGAFTAFGGVSRIRSSVPHVDTPSWDVALTPVIGPAGAQQVQALGAAAAFAANLSVADQRTLSLGARWDLHAQLALKLQQDWVRIGASGGRLWSNATAQAGRARVTTVVLDFVF